MTVRNGILTVFVLVVALGLGVLTSAAHPQAQGTPTIPVKTQVWLDLTATAVAPTPNAALTATYEAEMENAILTLTAESQVTPSASPPPTNTPRPEDGTETPVVVQTTELVNVAGAAFMMGTTAEEAQQAVDECALYGTTCDIAWVTDSIPEHTVVVDSFRLELYEVSLEQYVQFLNSLGPESHSSGCSGQPCAQVNGEQENSYIVFDGTTYSVNPAVNTLPATWVTWYGADAYCRSIDRRLPTEAEWERAARGPQNLIYPWGNTFDAIRANSNQANVGGTSPVTDYINGISAFGVFNIAGNVQEWVSDWYGFDYYTQSPQANPTGPEAGLQKVLRGGSWDTGPLFLRTVHRRSAEPTSASSAIGFRCAADALSTTPPSTPAPTPTADTVS